MTGYAPGFASLVRGLIKKMPTEVLIDVPSSANQ